jgi:BirA family biotin operon repressor/biotin-[acetyl-CoA-carboxylase] ligase
MSIHTPELPAAYDLVEQEHGSDIRGVAAKLAGNGAEEGTLVWLKHQTRGTGRFGSQWHSAKGDLHCAIILQPDFPPAQYADMLLAGIVSMGNALAMHLSPMTALSYQWPGKLTIAGHTVAAVWVDYSEQETPWLVVSCSVNIQQSPADFSIPAMSIREAEGTTTLDSATLLEAYARQFITVINSWSENGQESLVEKWKIRGNSPGQEIDLSSCSGTISGILECILDNGDIEVKSTNSAVQKVCLSNYIEKIYI